MLGSFFAILCIVMIAGICGVLYIYFQQDTLDSLIEKSIEQTVMEKYHFNSTAASVHSFDKIQEELECCGSRGPEDWSRSVYQTVKELGIGDNAYKIPRSCCRIPESKACLEATELQPGDKPDPHILFTEGCSDKMMEFFEHNSSSFIGLGIGFILIGWSI